MREAAGAIRAGGGSAVAALRRPAASTAAVAATAAAEGAVGNVAQVDRVAVSRAGAERGAALPASEGRCGSVRRAISRTKLTPAKVVHHGRSGLCRVIAWSIAVVRPATIMSGGRALSGASSRSEILRQRSRTTTRRRLIHTQPSASRKGARAGGQMLRGGLPKQRRYLSSVRSYQCAYFSSSATPPYLGSWWSSRFRMSRRRC